MLDLLIKLLQGMGVPKKHIDAIKAEYAKTDGHNLDVDAILTDFRDNQLDLIKNDKSFKDLIDKAKSDAEAKRSDIIDAMVRKQFGLTAEELKDKSTKEIIELAHKKATATGDTTLNELNQQLVAANLKIKKLEEEDLPAEKARVELERLTMKKDAALEKLVAAKKLRVPLKLAMASIKELEASGKYIIEFGEDGELSIKTKDNLKPKNAEGTAILSLDDILTSKLEEDEALTKSNADEKGKPVPPGGGTGGTPLEKIKGATGMTDEQLYEQNPHLRTAMDNMKAIVKPAAPPQA